ncbi:N,N-dimethylformamidase beta subunit family domain-containing protein [Dyadobacter fermentans]|uniref:Fibronectin type III domain protein n=1 Tax=Dyadobacter fermentans (strain ATCC 700827 / DSM 18053 / CIP 107007 / KCTC 52180 / NS114) TaxID=471854 RepID=C6VTQ4_DYAFD|nr:N,N-dimethylformamidase beta subunit family domain-containing protein [Dyadobacter fermentans]ACT92997.1 Fibronectin type III domain protein [Dyadobacter fermentans DSM 18053]
MLRKLHYSIRFFIALIFLLGVAGIPVVAQNAIVTENTLPGSPPSEWDVDGSGDLSIQGFATDISYNRGETAVFKIKTDATGYTVKIYRLGYYQGNGASFKGDATITASSLPQTQPTCLTNPTGLVDCGNWEESARWDIPTSAVSGIYIAKLQRTDTPEGEDPRASHITFVVRDDASTADLFFQTSDATWQAYNVYGDNDNGRSLYTGVNGIGKASKVSYNRPFLTRTGGGGGGAYEDFLFNSEYPMIRFLEKNGYDMSYTTNIDTDRRGELILNHKVFMSVGHDEYWSQAMRNNVAAARNAGKHLAFFSGNEVYWRTRWENSISTGEADRRTLVCYKEGAEGENQCNGKCDTSSPEWTGLWRSGCEYTGSGGCNPENELSGQISWDGTTGTIQVPSNYKNLRFWRNTSVAQLSDGSSETLTANTLGYEWNPEQENYRSSYPAGRILLSRSVVAGKIHHLSLYKHSSGALVFGAGTVQWTWGLDDQHDRGNEPVSRTMQQATINLFADMGVQPATLQTDLTAASESDDDTAPTVAITAPAEAGNVPVGSVATITGTAADGKVIAGVEVSTDNGVSWRLATGTNAWTFTWVPSQQGAATIRARSFDDSGNISEVAITNVNVSEPEPLPCPCTVFLPTDVPDGNVHNDGGRAIQLGMKFRSAVAGFVTGVRFYKHPSNTGTHIGQLYSNAGVLLAEATFVNETESGWQQVQFGAPVAISSNTTYVISYHSSQGYYSAMDSYFQVPKQTGALKGLANEEDGKNGIYIYSATPAFPNSNYESSNYYVDIVFETESGPDTAPPTVTMTSPGANATGIHINNNITVRFSEGIDAATVSGASVVLSSGGQEVPANITYDAGSLTVTIDPASALGYATVYTLLVKGGGADPRIKDVAGNALAEDFSFSFTTQNAPGPSPNDGPGGPILVLSAGANPFSRFPVEILRAEGLNAFAAKDISEISGNPALLDAYDVIVLGEIGLSGDNINALTAWVNAGGTLIGLRPAAGLASLFGISPAGGSLSDRYLKVNTATGPGVGIVDESIQFHGTADLYTLAGATSIATLYSDATNATINPAITLNNVGPNGGKAIAFTYDLARSIVYTRQGNPAWAGQERDNQSGPIRSDDLFFPDWIDLNKVAIPQADEQQRLLANLILLGNLHKKPLPRLWYLPRGLKAAVIMTGDDHGSGGTIGRFDDYISRSAANDQQAVDNWTAIRGTSYIYPNTPITNAQASAFQAQGFEIGVHLNTNCSNFDETSLRGFFNTQLAQMTNNFPGLSPTITLRTHCIAWSDWATMAKVELENGIRLDANYYYWPGSWVADRPGMFTGSGIPMRFADLDGSLIDVYQAATQMTDESDMSYTKHITTLLDNALGSRGYYGVFTANMHTDASGSTGSDVIITEAQARQVPVISARQMLTWLDGRNNSSFGALSWTGNTLNFTISAAAGSGSMQAMVPTEAQNGHLVGITVDGNTVSYSTQVIKGISYAFFPANNGSYVATYEVTETNQAPQISNVTVTQPVAGSATITWTTDEPADSRVDYGTSGDALTQNSATTTPTTSHSVTLTGLLPGTTYHFRVTSADELAASSTSPASSDAPLSFTTAPNADPACFEDLTAAHFSEGTTGTGTLVTAGGVTLKPIIVEDFTNLPPTEQWQSFPWDGGGSSTISDGQLVVNGARFNTEPVGNTLSPGTSIEFVATFGASTFQHIGLGAGNNTDMYNSAGTWIMFSTGASGAMQARVNLNNSPEDVNLGGGLIGTPHLYRIEWNATNILFYVDGTLVHTSSKVISTPMRFGISDYHMGAPGVSIDWVRITPYVPSGSFTSRVYDAGGIKTWQTANWTTTLPEGTSVQLLQRQGNVAEPDDSWSAFTSIPGSGSTVGGSSRYIQYRADLSTSNTAVTPVLQSVAIHCADPVVTCNAGTEQVALSANAITNTCPVTTVNLSSLVTGTLPEGVLAVFYTTADHQEGTQVADPLAAPASGTYYAFYFDTHNSCFNTANSTAIVTATATDCTIPTDLRPYLVMDHVEFTADAVTNPLSLRVRNTKVGSNATARIYVQIYKPVPGATIALTGQAAVDWVQESENANYYEFYTDVDIPYAPTGGYVITATLTIPAAATNGAYDFKASIKDNSGGEDPASYTNNNVVIGVSKQ